MTKYRKRPVVVEATQFFYDGPFPVPGVWYPTKDPDDGGTYIGDAYVVTIHGQRAYLENGDWVITEPDGEHHYPCKPDIFANVYEEASSDTPKPDWSQAPEWANWWAVDGNGATWYEYEPIADRLGDWTVGNDWDDMGQWDSAGDIEIPIGIDWRTLKEQRQKEAANGQ